MILGVAILAIGCAVWPAVIVAALVRCPRCSQWCMDETECKFNREKRDGKKIVLTKIRRTIPGSMQHILAIKFSDRTQRKLESGEYVRIWEWED